MTQRWLITTKWMTGRWTNYTVDTEERAKELAQATKDQYKGCRVFVGVELEHSTPLEDSDD